MQHCKLEEEDVGIVQTPEGTAMAESLRRQLHSNCGSNWTSNVTADTTVEVQKYLGELRTERLENPLGTTETIISELEQICCGVSVFFSFICALRKS